MKYTEYLLDVLKEKEERLNKELATQESLVLSIYVTHKEPYIKKYVELESELKLLDDCRSYIKQFM